MTFSNSPFNNSTRRFSGYLEEREFTTLCKAIGDRFSRVTSITLAQFDTNQDGLIDFDEVRGQVGVVLPIPPLGPPVSQSPPPPRAVRQTERATPCYSRRTVCKRPCKNSRLGCQHGSSSWKIRRRRGEACRSAHEGQAPLAAWYDKACMLWVRWELRFTRARSGKPESDQARPRAMTRELWKVPEIAVPEPDAADHRAQKRRGTQRNDRAVMRPRNPPRKPKRKSTSHGWRERSKRIEETAHVRQVEGLRELARARRRRAPATRVARSRGACRGTPGAQPRARASSPGGGTSAEAGAAGWVELWPPDSASAARELRVSSLSWSSLNLSAGVEMACASGGATP